jgi:hypothetical protein
MPQRAFLDPTGGRWMVWDVYPQDSGLSSEDRRKQERRGAPPSGPMLERRDRRERREREGGSGGGFVAGLDGGWLVFREPARNLIRRLAPPPEDWETCDEATLHAYWERAAPGRGPGDGHGASPSPSETKRRLRWPGSGSVEPR